ncbi:ABC transporter [Neobacillus niacini]|uniref:ABC transporter n=1 Tax=Neobacillus niacini TaxID=86668 RepID=UPI002863B981|nr:ABC transporter [Neobacillus niacini]MDR7000142.1 Zn-dependent protease with chaperone function [Neobacillus niacini]
MGHHCQGHCHILGIFLGFFTGMIWLLLAVLGYITDFFGLIDLGNLGYFFTILIAVIGFLAFFVFGLYVFKRAWNCCR